MSNRVGEIVESNTTGFVAQSYELDAAPPFGSLVSVANGSLKIFGLVYDVTTTSIDPGRRAIARGKDEDDQEAVYRNNPQLPLLFRTDFSCLVVGFGEGEDLFHFFPPRPPRVHSFVYQCDPDELVVFSESLDFLSSLISSPQAIPADELVAAFLRLANRARGGDGGFLVTAGKELAVLFANDLRRLNAILRRIRP
jgi:hypothetical protein